MIGDILVSRDLTIAVAESCTGGLIGSRLTDISGSSRYFSGGIIAYSNRVKMDLLGVSGETIESYGAVSYQTAEEMARGVKTGLNTNLGLAVTGIAGPEGGTKEKPVGTVFIGLATKSNTFSGRYIFKGTREQIKKQSASKALDWVKRYLNGDPFLPGI